MKEGILNFNLCYYELPKGVLQPQIVTHAPIMKQMKASHTDMPPKLPLPLPLSAAYHHLVLRIIDFDVFF
jgi:hypothetical protein